MAEFEGRMADGRACRIVSKDKREMLPGVFRSEFSIYISTGIISDCRPGQLRYLGDAREIVDREKLKQVGIDLSSLRYGDGSKVFPELIPELMEMG